jgi:excisionase family DNA binding protein
MNDEWLTAKAVAEMLGLSRPTIYRMLEDGDLEAHRIRGQYRIPPGAVERVLSATRINSKEVKPDDRKPQ